MAEGSRFRGLDEMENRLDKLGVKFDELKQLIMGMHSSKKGNDTATRGEITHQAEEVNIGSNCKSEVSNPTNEGIFPPFNYAFTQAPQMFDKSPVMNFYTTHTPENYTSPYTLSVQTTLSSGQFYYALEPITVCENANSFGTPDTESLNIRYETEVAEINMKIVGEAGEVHSRTETDTEIAYKVGAVNEIGNEIELKSEIDKSLEVVMEEKVLMKYVPSDPVKEGGEVKKSSEKKANKQKSKAQPSDQAKGVSTLPQPKESAYEVASYIVINLNSQATILLVDNSHGMAFQKTLGSQSDLVTTRSLLKDMKFDPSHDWGDAELAKMKSACVPTARPWRPAQQLTDRSVALFYVDDHPIDDKSIGRKVLDNDHDGEMRLFNFGSLPRNKMEFIICARYSQSNLFNEEARNVCSLMVALLARARLIDEARIFLEEKQIARHVVALQTFLARCRINQCINMRKRAIEQLCELEPLNAENYVTLSTLYAYARNSESLMEIQQDIMTSFEVISTLRNVLKTSSLWRNHVQTYTQHIGNCSDENFDAVYTHNNFVEGLKQLFKFDPMGVCTIEESGEHIFVDAGELRLEICLKDWVDDFMGDADIIQSVIVLSFRETVREKYVHTEMGKSPNKHNSLFIESRPLKEGVAEAFLGIIIKNAVVIVHSYFNDLQRQVQGNWTKFSKWNTLVDPLTGEPFIRVSEIDEQGVQPFVDSLSSCPKHGLHNPFKALERYLLYGDITAKAAHMLSLPEVSDFFTRLIQRFALKSYQQALGEVYVTQKFLENFCGDQVCFLARLFAIPGNHLGQQSHGFRWPYGPVAIINPFNFPLEIPVLQLMGALYMGNKPVLKVDSKVCIVMEQMLRLLHACGLPVEDVDFINSEGKTMKKLLPEGTPCMTLFTGSSRVADKLAIDLKGRKKLKDAGFGLLLVMGGFIDVFVVFLEDAFVVLFVQVLLLLLMLLAPATGFSFRFSNKGLSCSFGLDETIKGTEVFYLTSNESRIEPHKLHFSQCSSTNNTLQVTYSAKKFLRTRIFEGE